jgi:Fic family protein
MHSLKIENESMTDLFDRIDDLVEETRRLMEKLSPEQLGDFWNQLDISAIYHDCALEGKVISSAELKVAFDPRFLADSKGLTLYTSLRQHKKAFEIARIEAVKKKVVYNLDLFKMFHMIFENFEIPQNEMGFRKEIPLHRTYFHEIKPASEIQSSMDELIEWMNSEKNFRQQHPFVWAGRFHSSFMRIFPYLNTSGKIGRIVMNIFLMSQGYLPAVVHATERQRYYEDILAGSSALAVLFADSEEASLNSALRYLRRLVR